MKKENEFQKELINEIEERFPNCFILKNDPTYCQGIPDLLVLWHDKWAMLECKRSKKEALKPRPNQFYYIDLFDEMSFAALIYPENKEVILDELERSFTRYT